MAQAHEGSSDTGGAQHAKREVEFDIEIAKERVELCKKSYENGNEEWKLLLTKTFLGQEIQAMYLGIKSTILDADDDYYQCEDGHLANLFKNYVGKAFGVIGDQVIFSERAIKKVIDRYPEHFSDYDPNLPMESYIRDYILPHEEESSNDSQQISRRDLRIGLLNGYPYNAVEQYATHLQNLRKFNKFSNSENL